MPTIRIAIFAGKVDSATTEKLLDNHFFYSAGSREKDTGRDPMKGKSNADGHLSGEHAICDDSNAIAFARLAPGHSEGRRF